MRKKLSFLLLLGVLFVCQSTANAVLTNQAPAKHQNVNKQTSTKTSKPAAPNISLAQKQKYYNDYLNYLEQTIKDMGCFTSTEMQSADITVNLYFDSNYNVSKAYVSKYSHHDVDIDHDAYNRKCKMCESKLFVTKFKPFDSRYADGQHSTKEFYITLKDVDAQKRIAAKQVSGTLKDDYFTPPNNTSSCIAKVVLNFGRENFYMKSYSIISSSGDSEYNQMAAVALKRAMNSCNWGTSSNHYEGDVTIYLKFSGDKITPTSDPDSFSTNSSYYPTKNSNVGSDLLKFPKFSDSIFDTGNSILP